MSGCGKRHSYQKWDGVGLRKKKTWFQSIVNAAFIFLKIDYPKR